MFGISALQYMVFLIIAIPPFFIGYFKGWRAAVASLILVIIVGGILVGISFAIYDSFLWPLFKYLFLSSHNPAHLDIQTLKEVSKLSIISISIGIGMLPCSLLFLIVYFIFKKFFSDYMKPIIKKISSNEVKISRKNLKYTRIGGVLINGSVGLIIASATVGGVATLTTPANSSFFTKMTNVFGDVMTFGQGQYDNDFQEIFELVNDGEYYSEEIQKFRNLLEISQESDGKLQINENNFLKFNSDTPEHFDFVADTNLIASNSERISKALILMFLNTSNAIDNINIVGYNGHGINDGIENINLIDKNIEDSIQVLKNKINSKSNIIGIKWNSNGVLKGIKEYLNKREISFFSSPYYSDWAEQNGKCKIVKQELSSRKKELSELKVRIPSNRKKIYSLVEEINLDTNKIRHAWKNILSSLEKLGEGYHANADLRFVDFNSDFWNDQIKLKNNNNIFENSKNTIENLEPLKHVILQNKSGIYMDWKAKKEVWDQKSLVLKEKISNWNNAKNKIDSLNKDESIENSNLKNSIRKEKNALDLSYKAKAFINDGYLTEKLKLEKEKEKENKKIAELNSKIMELGTGQEEKDKITLEIKQSNSKLISIQKQQLLLDSKLSNNESELKRYEDIVIQEKDEQAKIKLKIKNISEEIIIWKGKVDSFFDEYKLAKSGYEKANKIFNNINSTYKKEEKIIIENNSAIKKLEAEIGTKFSLKNAMSNEHNNNISRKVELEDISKNTDSHYLNEKSIAWEEDYLNEEEKLLEIKKIKKDKMYSIYKERKKLLAGILVNIFT